MEKEMKKLVKDPNWISQNVYRHNNDVAGGRRLGEILPIFPESTRNEIYLENKLEQKYNSFPLNNSNTKFSTFKSFPKFKSKG